MTKSFWKVEGDGDYMNISFLKIGFLREVFLKGSRGGKFLSSFFFCLLFLNFVYINNIRLLIQAERLCKIFLHLSFFFFYEANYV